MGRGRLEKRIRKSLSWALGELLISGRGPNRPYCLDRQPGEKKKKVLNYGERSEAGG